MVHALQIFSLLMSSFKEVLWLDNDNYPTVDPTAVFDMADYRRDGALFWPDYCNLRSSRQETWALFDMQPPATWPPMKDGQTSIWYACIHG